MCIYISALLQYKLYPHYIPLLNPAIQKRHFLGIPGIQHYTEAAISHII